MKMKLSLQRAKACAPQLPLVGALCVALLAGSACHKTPSSDAAKSDAGAKSAGAAKTGDDKSGQAGEGVSLTQQQVEKIGVLTEPVKSVGYSEETAGYGTVMPHETIATAVAELAVAAASERQSRVALARMQSLSGTPGAIAADAEETQMRQAAVDTAALTLARRRFSATFGQTAPFGNGEDQPLLQALANGSTQLVRVTFPLGSMPGDTPKLLSAARIGESATGKRWKLTTVWPAPADASIPGRSFFAVLRAGNASEGERIVAWAPIGGALSGVLIPAEAVIISEGDYWCYLERKPGTFVRTKIDARRPLEDGYFVTEGVSAGDKVVTKAAAQLLAQESNPGAEDD